MLRLHEGPFKAVYAGNSRAVLEWSWSNLKHNNWTVVVSGFFEPLLFLIAMGYGVGSLVGTIDTGSGPQDYVYYIAPALLTVSAMNGALADTTWNVYFKMHVSKVYGRMLNTPLGPLDIALAEIGMALLRGTFYAIGFTVVMAGFGLLASPASLLMIPMALFVAFGFASLGMGITSYCRKFQHMDWIEIVKYPMFMLSGVFFPISQYPEALQWLVQALPLWHGIELMRAAQLGVFGPQIMVHVLYFAVLIVIGLVFSTRRMQMLFMS